MYVSVVCLFLLQSTKKSRCMAKVVNLVYTYLTREIEDTV